MTDIKRVGVMMDIGESHKRHVEVLAGIDAYASGKLVAEYLLSRGFLNMAAFIHPEDRAVLSQTAAFKAVASAASNATWCGTLAIPWATNHSEWQQTILDVEKWMDSLELPVGLLVREPSHARLVVNLACGRPLPEGEANQAATWPKSKIRAEQDWAFPLRLSQGSRLGESSDNDADRRRACHKGRLQPDDRSRRTLNIFQARGLTRSWSSRHLSTPR